MSARFGKARRDAFFKALRETGNQSLAAERAKVSRSWVQLHRSSDPAFDGAVRAAISASFDRLRMSGSGKPSPSWAYLDGEELVVRGTNGVRVQIARARVRQWTPRVEGRFLVALAASCNVKLACAEAGLSVPSVYLHRRRWPAFAARWDAAIAVGYDRLDQELVACAIRGMDPEFRASAGWEEAPIPPMTVDEAIRLTGLHQRRARRPGKWPGVRQE